MEGVVMTTAREIREILMHPEGRDWTIQGLGMLRLYLDDEHVERLHVWDPVAATANVSTVHDHPWDFSSRIVSGVMRNIRYIKDDQTATPTHFGAQIFCGAGGGLIDDTITRYALSLRYDPKPYVPGDVYSQEAPELHESMPAPGAVTLIRRTFGPDRDLAHVFWRTGRWVSAEPRPATADEVSHFCNLALNFWRE